MTKKTFIACLLAGLLSACATAPRQDNGAAVEERTRGAGADGRGRDAATSYGAGSDSPGGLSALTDPQSPLALRTIYFAYDSSEIQPQFQEVIEAHSAYLLAHPQVTAVLEGHADERGSREYNLALGERRAQMVKRLIALLGVPNTQLRTSSYGEERPVADGHNEAAWRQNRRVEILY